MSRPPAVAARASGTSANPGSGRRLDQLPRPPRVTATGEKPRSRLGRIPAVSVCLPGPARTRAPLVATPPGVFSDQQPLGPIAFLGKQDPVPPIRADLQAALGRVLAEQDDRARITADP